jgi:hypothetical protein
MFERLTFHDDTGVACYRWKLPHKTVVIANEAISRLAAYEDTDLSPEEAQELKAERDYWEREAKKWCAKLGEIRIMAEGGMDYVTNNNL